MAGRLRGRLGWVLLALGAYLVFLVAGVPAAAAWQWLGGDPVLRRAVQLQGLAGTVWDGEAAAARVRGMDLGRVEWELRLLPLAWGELAARVAFRRDDGSGRGEVGRGLGGALRLREAELRLPAQALMPLLYGYPVVPQGEAVARLKRLEVAPGERFTAEGRIVWRGAGFAAPRPMDLGDLVVTLAPDGEGGTRGTLADAGGPLSVEGVLTIGADGTWQLKATLAARESGSPVAGALRFLGRPDARGRVTLVRRGRLPLR